MSALLIDPFFERYVLAHEQEHIAFEVMAEAQQLLVPADFELPTSRVGVFQALHHTLPGVSNLTAFDRTGRVVWSRDERQVGRLLTDDSRLARALAGEAVSLLEGAGQYRVRTYVPIALAGSVGITGVIETSKAFTPVVLGIRHTQRLIMGMAGAMGLLLYLALGALAWGSSAAERRAIGRLEIQNRQLALIQRYTHSLLTALDSGRPADEMLGSVGAVLDLSRASLYQVSPSHELSLVADWKVQDAGACVPPDGDLIREALGTRRAVLRSGIVAVPLLLPSSVHERGHVGSLPSTYLLVGAIRRALSALSMPLDIMLDEAAIALAHAALFAATREAHEHLAAILAGIADRMVILDRDLRLVWMNGVSAETYGRGLGLPCFEVLGTGGCCENCPAVRTFKSARVEHAIRTERLPGGAVRHLDLVTAPLLDASGSVREVLEVARDITELVELEERLERSATSLQESHAALLAKTEELQAVNEALGQAQAQLVEKERLAAAGEVVVGLHHSILNPLAGILGALQVLKQGALVPAKREEAFEQAEGEIRKIEQVIRGLSALRRVAGTPYIGKATMLDLERSCHEDDPAGGLGQTPHT